MRTTASNGKSVPLRVTATDQPSLLLFVYGKKMRKHFFNNKNVIQTQLKREQSELWRSLYLAAIGNNPNISNQILSKGFRLQNTICGNPNM